VLGFKERLRQLIDAEEGGNQSALARRSELDPASIRQYLSGSQPTLSNALAIARAYGVSMDWLVNEENTSQKMMRTGDDFIAIPHLDVRASAGSGRLAVIEEADTQVVAFRRDWLRRLGVNPKHAQIIVAEGDSMYPTISHGDLVLVDRSIDKVVDEGIYVLVYAGLVKLKRIQVLLSGVVLLKSDNPAYQTEEVRPHEQPELIIEGRVRWTGGAV
jgi:phage repressor protein C with HTH and peptisase S24 domain